MILIFSVDYNLARKGQLDGFYTRFAPNLSWITEKPMWSASIYRAIVTAEFLKHVGVFPRIRLRSARSYEFGSSIRQMRRIILSISEGTSNMDSRTLDP